MKEKREGGLFAALAEGLSVISEKNAIRTFCSNSLTFKIMQKNSFSGDSGPKQELIQSIQGANTFSDMLPLIDTYGPGLGSESMATKALFNTVVFFGSYVNTDANFLYYLPTLKKEIINYAVEHGYELKYRQGTSHGM